MARQELPRYVDISSGLHRGGPAFLGPIDALLCLSRAIPRKSDFIVQNLQMNGSPTQLDARRRCFQDCIVSVARIRDGASATLCGADAGHPKHFRGQRRDRRHGSGAARAFDVSRETDEFDSVNDLHIPRGSVSVGSTAGGGGRQCCRRPSFVRTGEAITRRR